MRARLGAQARNVQSGVVGTVVQYSTSAGGVTLVYIKVDGGHTMWCDPGLWEAVDEAGR